MAARKPGPFLPNPTNDEPGVWTQNALASRVPALVKGYTAERVAPGNVFDRRYPADFTASAIRTEITAIGSGSGTIHLRPGNWVVDSALVVPINVGLIVEHGAKFIFATGGSIAISGPFEAQLSQVFSGFSPGDVLLSGNEPVHPEWWGAAASAANNAPALNSALAATSAGGMVEFSQLYPTTDAVAAPSGRPIIIRGNRPPFTANAAVFGDSSWAAAGVYKGAGIVSALTSGDILSMSGNFGAEIHGIIIAGPGSGTANGIHLSDGHVDWSDVLVCNCYVGAQLDNIEVSTIARPRFRGCTSGMVLGTNSNANTILGIDVSACGTGATLTTCDGNRFYGGAVQGCATYGINTASSVEECLFDGIYFENALATAAINLDGDQNKIVNCHQGYADHDVFLVDGAGHSIELAKYAKAVVLAATSSRVRIRSVGAWPSGSSDAGSNNVREQIDDDGITYSTAAGTTVHAIQLSGSTKGYYCLNTTGGIAWSVNARDDVGHVRLLDAANNVAYMAMKANGVNPQLSFYGQPPVSRPALGATNNVATLNAIASALTSIGLVTAPTKSSAGAAPPVAGTYGIGDFFWNTAPAEFGSGGSKYIILGWSCTAAGEPGTWLECRCLTGN